MHFVTQMTQEFLMRTRRKKLRTCNATTLKASSSVFYTFIKAAENQLLKIEFNQEKLAFYSGNKIGFKFDFKSDFKFDFKFDFKSDFKFDFKSDLFWKNSV